MGWEMSLKEKVSWRRGKQGGGGGEGQGNKRGRKAEGGRELAHHPQLPH